ncbi:MAG: Rpn family recombination-promoting nuclease/putative transposase [Planctomycetaceae bacterium]|jgi:hypothetical protein|nr:Rpn family recombination-promoting nuclease/putative transposase [Planctomycetaceae bacterium]
MKPQHDKLARKVFGKPTYIADLLKNNTETNITAPLDLDNIQRLPNHNVGSGLRESISDMRFIVPVKGGNKNSLAMILTEHKSEPDDSLMLYVGDYLFDGWKAWFVNTGKRSLKQYPLPAPLLVILYNGKKPLSVKRFREIVTFIKGFERFIPDFEVLIIDLSLMKPQDFKGLPITKATLEALKYGGAGTITEHLSDIFANYNSVPLNNEVRENVQDIVEYAHSNDKDLNVNQIEQALEKVFPESEIKIMTSVMLRDVKAEGKAEAIVDFLKVRFHSVPKEMTEKIIDVKNTSKIKTLVKYAATCQTLDEFASKLK